MFLLSAFLPFGSKFCVKTSESETDGWEGTTLIVDSSYQPVVGDDLSVKTTYQDVVRSLMLSWRAREWAALLALEHAGCQIWALLCCRRHPHWRLCCDAILLAQDPS